MDEKDRNKLIAQITSSANMLNRDTQAYAKVTMLGGMIYVIVWYDKTAIGDGVGDAEDIMCILESRINDNATFDGDTFELWWMSRQLEIIYKVLIERAVTA